VLRQAEVEELRARRREHHVSWLQVAMYDAASVSGFEGIRDIAAKAEDLRKWQCPTPES
jgi:hypothetical protein